MIIDTPLWNSESKICNEDGLEIAASTVYEPAEDTFLMLDALQLDLEHIVNERLVCQNRAVADTSLKGRPLLVVELGCGAGLLTAAVGKAFRDCGAKAYAGAHCLAVDINPAACYATSQTCQLNGVQADIVCGDLLTWMRRSEPVNTVSDYVNVYGPIDILLFNPPYVRGPDGEPALSPTAINTNPRNEDAQDQFLSVMADAAWLGGGPDGVDVLKRALHQAADLLSEEGVFYALMINYNYAALVRDEMEARKKRTTNDDEVNLEYSTDDVLLTTFGSNSTPRPLACHKILSRHVPGERLAVYRIYRPHVMNSTTDNN